MEKTLLDIIIGRRRTHSVPTMAVCHPCNEPTLRAVVEAARRRIVDPLLIGPAAQLKNLAAEIDVDVSNLPVIDTRSIAESAARAVQLCREGEADALMKGSLHTDELMREVVRKRSGLRTRRRMSHVYIVQAPNPPHVLLITDAGLNIESYLDEKVDIVQNAIDLARILGIGDPRVALLSAVETVHSNIASTVDAAALCKMAERGQIEHGVLDGPLAIDNVLSQEAARIKGIDSQVAGRADILVAPDLEAGNIVAKQLILLTGADAAGVVLGASVPIAVPSRAESPSGRLAACAVAGLYPRGTEPCHEEVQS